MAAIAKISAAQATSINLARQHASADDRKAIKREVYQAVKAALGIPVDTKVKVEVDSAQPDYLVLKESKTNNVFPIGDDGRWTGARSEAGNDAAPKRWFQIPLDEATQLLTEHVAGHPDTDFDDDGTDDAPHIGHAAGALHVTADAVYVQIPQTEF